MNGWGGYRPPTWQDAAAELLREAERAPQPGAEPGDLDELVRRAQAGDPQAREELIEHLLPLVNSIARAYRTTGLEHPDLVQEGCVGILRALQRFDPDRGVPFAAYAALWIRQALQELRSPSASSSSGIGTPRRSSSTLRTLAT